jgi:hypothetical protein
MIAVVVFGSLAWALSPPPWKNLPDGTLVVVEDGTRGYGGAGWVGACHKIGRCINGDVKEWRDA